MITDLNQILFLARAYRLVWLSGRFGGGKTLLAIALAYYLSIRYGYHIVTNISCIYNEPLPSLDDNGQLRAVIVLDEAGLYIDNSSRVQKMAAYAAKMDVVYLLPSFHPPAPRARVVTIQPVFGFSAIGIPLWVYRWTVSIGGFKDEGTFYFCCPAEFFGVYSRNDPARDPADIIAAISDRVAQFRERYGYRDETGSGVVEGAADLAILLRDAVDELSRAADRISAVSDREGRQRRRFRV